MCEMHLKTDVHFESISKLICHFIVQQYSRFYERRGKIIPIVQVWTEPDIYDSLSVVPRPIVYQGLIVKERLEAMIGAAEALDRVFKSECGHYKYGFASWETESNLSANATLEYFSNYLDAYYLLRYELYYWYPLEERISEPNLNSGKRKKRQERPVDVNLIVTRVSHFMNKSQVYRRRQRHLMHALHTLLHLVDDDLLPPNGSNIVNFKRYH